MKEPLDADMSSVNESMDTSKRKTEPLYFVESALRSERKLTATEDNGITMEEKNSYFLEIKPALILLRAFGRFPYNFTKTGPAPFSFFSIPVFYSVLFYLGSCYWSYWVNKEICQRVLATSANFDEQMFSIMLILFSINNFIVPITFWTDAHKFVRYIQQWKELEDLQRKEGFQMKYGYYVKIMNPIMIFLITLIGSMETLLFPNVPWYAFLQFVPIVVGSTEYHQVIWTATLLEVKRISEDLLIRIQEANSKVELSNARLAKLLADQAASSLGKALGTTLLTVTALTFGCFILCVYCLLQILVHNVTDIRIAFWGLLVLSCIYASGHYLHCEIAHRATSQMRDEFRLKLLEMNIKSKRDGCEAELNLILHGIQLSPPVVQYNGFITIDRRLITNYFAVTVTYLIVLIQFSSSAKEFETALNSTKIIIEEKKLL